MIVVPIAAMTAATGRSTIEARLTAARATSARRAIDLAPGDVQELAGLDEAIGLGRVLRAGSGKYFLNPAATAKPSGEMAMAVLLFLVVAASVVASVVAFARFAID